MAAAWKAMELIEWLIEVKERYKKRGYFKQMAW
jgi:hypothetical protein